jgi:hypothetical protein
MVAKGRSLNKRAASQSRQQPPALTWRRLRKAALGGRDRELPQRTRKEITCVFREVERTILNWLEPGRR